MIPTDTPTASKAGAKGAIKADNPARASRTTTIAPNPIAKVVKDILPKIARGTVNNSKAPANIDMPTEPAIKPPVAPLNPAAATTRIPKAIPIVINPCSIVVTLILPNIATADINIFNATAKAILQFTIDNKFVQEFDSIKRANNYFGKEKTNIWMVLN
jgi:hypothetical protein